MEEDLSILKGAPRVAVGDKVVINLGTEIIKKMQIGHGGWSDPMKKYLGKKGTVQKHDIQGDVEIKFKGATLTYNPDVVAKVLRKGDIVEITKDLKKAEFLQESHGGWNQRMEKILGGVGKIKHVFDSYDIVLITEDDTWSLNPLLCTVIKECSSDSESDDDEAPLQFFSKFAKEMTEQIFQMGTMDSSVTPTSGLTDLQRSVFERNTKKIEELLESGVNVNESNKNGDTALHLAVLKSSPNIVKLLLSKGAKADICNKKKVAPIHIAIVGSQMECVKQLAASSINVEDNDGDTPLGIAILQKDTDIIEILMKDPNIDLTKKNDKGFSPFHLAAGIGDAETVGKIVKKKPDIVDIQKSDGFTALHVAVINGQFGVTKVLIKECKAGLNLKTMTGGTPLMLAAGHNYLDIVKMLVTEGAELNSKDEDGDTVLHHAINGQENPMSIFEMFISRKSTDLSIDVIMYLVENGASLHIQNKKGQTPLDLIDDASLKAELQKKADKRPTFHRKMNCKLCSEKKILVEYQPCGHSNICTVCDMKNKQIKKCIECQVEITGKIQPEEKEKENVYKRKALFKEGDKISIIIESEDHEAETKKNPRIKELIEKVGCVVNTEKEEMEVLFEGGKYHLQPEILVKVFTDGDKVELLKDIELVKVLQEGHSGWTDGIEKVIGKIGRVIKTVKQFIHVKFDEEIFHINPMACVAITKPVQDTEGARDATCCIKCYQITVDMFPLQCGHAYCSNCKVFGKCMTC